MIDLSPGEILMPDLSEYSYCLKVEKVTPWDEGAWWPEGWYHCEATRYDVTRDGRPQFTHASKGHIRIIKQVSSCNYIDRNSESLQKYVKQTALAL